MQVKWAAGKVEFGYSNLCNILKFHHHDNKSVITVLKKRQGLTGVNEDSINVDFGTDRTQDEATGRAEH